MTRRTVRRRRMTPGLVAKIAGLAHVKRVADFTIVDPNVLPLVPFHLQLLPGETPPTSSAAASMVSTRSWTA